MNQYIKISPEVADALQQHLPIVALESTIISHGMPYPQNRDTAFMCEDIIRHTGVVPATIAIIDGIICVGLTTEEIEHIAKAGSHVIKTSRRDLPYIVATKQDGATTVSATMCIANQVGIKIFATGGIGGVHRDVSETMDISADLEELKMTSVAVVCAGVKAILDLPRTLEYLETKGVPVIGYQTDYLPAFYTRTSPYKVNVRMDDSTSVAALLKAKWELGLTGGVLIANPIPKDNSLDETVMNQAIDQAIRMMKERGITGKDTTPYLLKTVKELTDGKSLHANIALVYHNCLVAAEIAKAYCQLFI